MPLLRDKGVKQKIITGKHPLAKGNGEFKYQWLGDIIGIFNFKVADVEILILVFKVIYELLQAAKVINFF